MPITNLTITALSMNIYVRHGSENTFFSYNCMSLLLKYQLRLLNEVHKTFSYALYLAGFHDSTPRWLPKKQTKTKNSTEKLVALLS